MHICVLDCVLLKKIPTVSDTTIPPCPMPYVPASLCHLLSYHDTMHDWYTR